MLSGFQLRSELTKAVYAGVSCRLAIPCRLASRACVQSVSVWRRGGRAPGGFRSEGLTA